MIKMKKVAAVAALAVTAMAVAQVARIELLGFLSGTGTGKVSWKINDKGTQKQAELQAEGERLAPNTAYAITIAGNPAFAVMTNGFGAYRLVQRYTTAARPTIVAGDSVSVTDGNAVVVQSGAMQAK